jgi:hypothetical protein
MLVRGVAIPRQRLQSATICGLESDGNSGSHASDSHASSHLGIPSGIQMSDCGGAAQVRRRKRRCLDELCDGESVRTYEEIAQKPSVGTPTAAPCRPDRNERPYRLVVELDNVQNVPLSDYFGVGLSCRR